MKRKQFCQTAAKTLVSTGLLGAASKSLSAHEPYKFNYIMCSAMYGNMKLKDILPEVKKIGANGIDLWPKVHADHREQAEAMGKEAFKELLQKNDVKIKGMACYKLGPFGLQKEMQYAKEVSGSGVTFVCASRGPRNLSPGPEMKKAVSDFCEKLKPHAAAAEKYGMTIAIENHANSLLHTRESALWFQEFSAYSDALGIAFAPHHFEKTGMDGEKMAVLLSDLDTKVLYFYAQQYGAGSSTTMPKDKELLQMPGRGSLDFCPMVRSMKDIDYHGPLGIFMHPYPRGLPILETVSEITAEINRSKAYLDHCLKKSV